MTSKYQLHCCPTCGHPVGVKRWFWRAWIWARWHCTSCGRLLRFDLHRRLIIGLVLALFYVLMLGVALLFMLSRVPPWIWVFPIILIGIVGMTFIIVRYDRIILAEEK